LEGPERSKPIEARNAGRVFGEFTAVDGVTLDAPEGAILGVIGPSGSGKTTLIRMLTGTLEPTSGEVRVLGENPRKFRRRTRERIGYMAQHFVLYEDLTAAENLSFLGALFGLVWRERSRRVREVLELVNLWDERNRRAKNFSGGMQRRLALAGAMIHEPDLLFLDEPTAGIDPMLRQTVWDEFRRMKADGQTLLVTTQYVTEAEYCDRVALLVDGKLIAFDDPQTLRREALGGDLIEIETTRAVDADLLSGVPGVKEVRQRGPRTLLAVVEEASTVHPRLLEEVRRNNLEVASSTKYHPTYDEVFAELVSSHNNRNNDVEKEGDSAKVAA
jgi:ABC-2 type transport system ATP-binding protein